MRVLPEGFVRVSLAPAVSIAPTTSDAGRVSVTMVIRGSKGQVRASALRPNLVWSRAKSERSAAAIMRRWADTMSAL